MAVYKKYFSLVTLIFQNSALVLTMRYSRTVEGPVYLASTAVVLTEILKFAVSFFMVFHSNTNNLHRTIRELRTEIIKKGHEMIKVSVPSILYTIQNNLLYIALSHLNAATFQVTYQLKILTTALFSVLMLNRRLDKIKWLSLVILMFAVVLVQMPSESLEEHASESDLSALPSFQMPSESLEEHASESDLSSALIGLITILLACISSGFSGVYIEKILKDSETSMWIRNIQLSLLGICFGLFGVFVTDWEAVWERGFFQGYSPVVGIVICLQALGGLVVAAVMKYADNILKGFATSISIVLSSIISYFILEDFHPSWIFVTGAVLVLVATFMYGRPQEAQKLSQTLTVLPVGVPRDPKGS